MYTVYTGSKSVYSGNMNENDLRELIETTEAKQAATESLSSQWYFHKGQLDILYDILQGKFY